MTDPTLRDTQGGNTRLNRAHQPSTLVPSRIHGMTLIELIITIVIVSIAATALLGVMSFIAKNSADNMIREQAESIAMAYSQQAYGAAFTSVDTYNGLNHLGARDQLGTLVAGLDQYQITMSVVKPAAFGPAGATVPALKARQITVTVAHPSGVSVTLSTYRTEQAWHP